MGYFSVDNKKFSIIFGSVLLIIAIICIVSLLWPASPKSQEASTKESPGVTTTKKPKQEIVESTTTTSSTTTTTTAPKAKSKIADETTTTTVPFSSTSTASLADESTDHCNYQRYVFAGSVLANKTGTVNWVWVRWDGASTGVSGTVEFDSNGNPTSSIDDYTLDINPFVPATGWAALKVTWDGGTYTSSHVNFNHVYGSGSLVASGC